MTAQPDNTIDGQGASEQPQPQEQVGGKQVDKLSEAFSYKPPVVVPFENKHYQVFLKGLDTRGTFTSSQMAKVGEDVKQLEYSIEYQFVPEKKNPGTKPNDPAYISVHLLARVTDLASERHADSTGVTNPQKAAQEANKARIDERRQFIQDDKDGRNAVYIAKQKQLEYHNHQFDLNSFQCWCGISKADAQSLDRLTADKEQADG